MAPKTKIEWCDKAEGPVFLKNNLKLRNEIWGQVVLRQEFPNDTK